MIELTDDAMRAQFTQWLFAQYPDADKRIPFDYLNPRIQGGWHAWQAAYRLGLRAGMEGSDSLTEEVMYPPPPYEVTSQADYFSGATAYRNAIKAAIRARLQELNDA